MLSASDNSIAWYENLGGGNFSDQRVITKFTHGARSVYAADLDGDGDTDAISASAYDDKIAWYENLGGGNFSDQRVITTDADGAQSVHAADLDGDGDTDAISASAYDDKIAWYENLGGGNFSDQRVITTDADGAQSVHAADLDGDGDTDIISASAYDDKIAWYSNMRVRDVGTDYTDEHGDTLESATPVATPSHTPGGLTGGDVDYFRIQVDGDGLSGGPHDRRRRHTWDSIGFRRLGPGERRTFGRRSQLPHRTSSCKRHLLH